MKKIINKASRPNRRQIIIGATALMIVLLIGYATASVLTWRSYEKQYNDLFNQSQQKIKRATTLPSTNNEQKTHKLQQAQKTTEEINRQRQGLCDVNSLMVWQQVMPVLDKMRADCQMKNQTLSKTIEILENLSAYLVAENKLSMVFSGLVRPSTDNLTEDKWAAQPKIWQQAGVDIRNINGPKQFDVLKKAALDYTNDIYSRWEELNKAHNAKDRPAFEAGRKKLEESYKGSGKVSEIAKSQLQSLIKPLSNKS